MIDMTKCEHLFWLADKLFAAGIFAPEVTSVERAFAVILAGDELGFAPVTSARLFAFVKNKLSLTADAQIGLCTRQRDVCEYFRVVESSATRAVYETRRAGSPEPTRLEYTIEQARTAGLVKGSTWTGHPAAMLRARCGAALARAVYPDLVGGMYDPDEADEIRRSDAPAQLPAEVPQRQTNAAKIDPHAAALDTYRARLAAAKSPDALVATVLELMPSVRSFRDAASAVAGERATELDVDLPALLADAEKISTDPAHWSVVARVLVPLASATTPAEVKALATANAEAVMKLPEALRKRLSDTLKVRGSALKAAAESAQPAANDSPAALLEDEIRRASTIPDLDAVAEKIEAAVKAKSITADQARALNGLYESAAQAMERAA